MPRLFSDAFRNESVFFPVFVDVYRRVAFSRQKAPKMDSSSKRGLLDTRTTRSRGSQKRMAAQCDHTMPRSPPPHALPNPNASPPSCMETPARKPLGAVDSNIKPMVAAAPAAAPVAAAAPAANSAVPNLALCCHPFRCSNAVSVMHPKKGYEPVILWVTGLLTFFAGLINTVGVALWQKNIGNLTGVVTKISLDLANMSGEYGELFTQFWAFVFGSLLSGLLVTARKAPKDFYRMSDRPVRRASIVLIIVAIFLFIGWAGTKHGGWKDEDNSVKFAPAFLAMAMGMQNGMTSKHAHAVIRTTHVTGVATDIGLLMGNILRREFMLIYEEKFEMKEIAADRLSAARKLTNVELESLRLLFVLLFAFFFGGYVGLHMYWTCGIDTLLFPAIVELAMGVGYLYFRTRVSKEGSKLMAEPLGCFSALRARLRGKFGKKKNKKIIEDV